MKATLLYSLTVICFVSFAQSYDKENFIRNFIESQRFKMTEEAEEVENFEVDDYYPAYIGSQDGLKAADKITSLPGQPSNGFDFDQYSGYVTVDPNAGRALFYYFAESTNPSTKPLVLWLNGGPGCSSFGYGAMAELGPLRVNSDNKTLWLNQYSWNKVANVLFLESPAGVGFSYSNTSSDYKTGDKKTAFDAYTFLINWLERFPEYKSRDFYITGESYAGHYVPQLAYLILNKNKHTKQTVIKIKGIAAGNAYIDKETGFSGSVDFLWSHALISDEIYAKLNSSCKYSSSGKLSDACLKYSYQAVDMTGNINNYNIYYPLCSIPSTTPKSEYDPCTDYYTYSYLNTPEVQRALHVNVTGKLPGPWGVCGGIDYKGVPATVLDVIQKLIASGIRVWFYSGDVDAVVSVTTTKYAIEKKLQLPVKTPWYPWYYQKEVGGYVVEYQNLTFVTVRGAGHFVPSYQPGRALAFFSSFLKGELPPAK